MIIALICTILQAIRDDKVKKRARFMYKTYGIESYKKYF
mgnify:CR=1 FL=1